MPAADAPLAQWLKWLEAGRGEKIVLGLERCEEVARRLQLTKPAPLVVTVAGTNGKGSSLALLQSIWRRAGYRVGAYTSPHLIRFNERMRINGEPLSDAVITAAFAVVESVRADVPLTYFEFATLSALYLFADAELDVALLEVGLGGRLDAVNIIDADIALITAIGVDHEQWLGETREAIGLEKAGIMRAATPAVCSDHAAPSSIHDYADETGAQLKLLGADFRFERKDESWDWWYGEHILENLPSPGLLGDHQYRNAAGALTVIQLAQAHLPVKETAIRAALNDVRLPGRFQQVDAGHSYIMDVAHNPQAGEIFAATLNSMPRRGRCLAIVGMLKTKKHRAFFEPLLSLVDGWFFTDLPSEIAASGEELRQQLRTLDRKVPADEFSDVAAAHAAALEQAREDDVILVLGSFLTVGAMLQELNAEPELSN